jgi:hypothetical protein
MANLVKMPAFDAPDPLDFKLLADAGDQWRKERQFNADQARRAYEFDRTNELARARQGLLERQAAREEDNDLGKRIASAASVIDGMQGPERVAAWGKLRTGIPGFDDIMAKYGSRGDDHVNGPKFLIAQAQGPRDPLRDEQMRAQTDLLRTNNAEAQRRGQIAEMDANTRRANSIVNIGTLFGGRMPSRDEWDTQNQPGGIVHAAFGGPMPYEKAPGILRLASDRVRMAIEPTEEERALGITKEHKLQALRDRAAAELHGVDPKDMVKRGQRVTPSGAIEMRPGAGTATERQAEVIATTGLQALKKGEDILKKADTWDQFWGDEGKYVGGIGEAGRGFRSMRQAILDLNFALSGKSVSNKEREEFLKLYMPVWNESRKSQKAKIDSIRNYFDNVIKMRKGGATDEDIAASYRRAIESGPGGGDEPAARRGGSGWKIERVQ